MFVFLLSPVLGKPSPSCSPCKYVPTCPHPTQSHLSSEVIQTIPHPTHKKSSSFSPPAVSPHTLCYSISHDVFTLCVYSVSQPVMNSFRQQILIVFAFIISMGWAYRRFHCMFTNLKANRITLVGDENLGGTLCMACGT